jgi:hypothetical protein
VQAQSIYLNGSKLIGRPPGQPYGEAADGLNSKTLKQKLKSYLNALPLW